MLGAGPGLQPVAGHITTAVRLAPRRPFGRRWLAVDMSLDERGLDKIIKAVGKKFVPAGLDRSALRRAIDESEKRAEIIAVHRRGARARKLLQKLKQVRETAEQLAVLLNTKDDASDLIQKLCGEWPRRGNGQPVDRGCQNS